MVRHEMAVDKSVALPVRNLRCKDLRINAAFAESQPVAKSDVLRSQVATGAGFDGSISMRKRKELHMVRHEMSVDNVLLFPPGTMANFPVQ